MGKDLSQLFEEVKNLKKDNLGIPISTQNALRYVRSQEHYKALGGEVAQKLRQDGIAFNPSLRGLANLCFNAYATIGNFIELRCELSTHEEGNENTMPRIYSIKDFNPIINRLYEKDSFELYEKYSFLEWPITFDYPHFLYLYGLEKEGDKTFRKSFMSALKSNYPFLTLPNGVKITLSGFANDSSLHLKPESEFDPDIRELIDENKDIFRLRFVEFVDWLEGRNSNFEASNQLKMINAKTYEETEFLYSHLDYDRALEEKILGRIETERQVALYRIYRSGDKPGARDLQPEESIDYSIKEIEESLFRKNKILNRIRVHDSPKILIDGILGELQKMNYIRLALKKNKNWLKDFLSR